QDWGPNHADPPFLQVRQETACQGRAGRQARQVPGVLTGVTVPAADEPPVLEQVEPVEESVSAPPAGRRPPRPTRPGAEEKDRPAGESQGEGGEAGRRARGADGPTLFWVRGNELLALSDDTVYLATLDENKLREAQADLEAGRPADEVLDSPDTVIT